MNGPIIGYKQISDDPLVQPQEAIYAHFGPTK